MRTASTGKFSDFFAMILIDSYLKMFSCRNYCFSNCVNDNFPNLMCENQNITLTYRGNTYDKLFFYPKTNSTFYKKC